MQELLCEQNPLQKEMGFSPLDNSEYNLQNMLPTTAGFVSPSLFSVLLKLDC